MLLAKGKKPAPHNHILPGKRLRQFLCSHVQSHLNNLVHVVILVLTQTAAENDVRLRIGQLLILGIQGAVLLVIDGIVRLVALFPFSTVLAADDRFGLGAELKVLMLDDAGVGGLGVGVV